MSVRLTTSILLGLPTVSAANDPGARPATVPVSIDPAGAGRAYDGLGALGTGITPLPIDYPERQRKPIWRPVRGSIAEW